MTCSPRSPAASPRSPAARAVISVGLPVVAPIWSASRSSDRSPMLMHTLPLHLGERHAAAVPPARGAGIPAGTTRRVTPGPARSVPLGTSVATRHLQYFACRLNAWAHHLWVPMSHRPDL